MRFSRYWWIALGVAGLAAGCGGGRGATPLQPSGLNARFIPGSSSSGTPTPSPCGINPSVPVWRVDFAYTGARTTWTVPSKLMRTTQVTVVAQGAQGSNALGGCERATISVTPGESLGIFVGGQAAARGQGGFNGGGNGGAACCGGNPGGGGGGASDVRQGGMAIADRVVVAGGGGGSSGSGWEGGAGGGARGGTGAQSATYARGAGVGGSQTQGGAGATGATNGALGEGGNGGTTATSRFGGGGGGGGYYGGGGGRYSDRNSSTGLDTGDSGAGGGSGFAASKAINVVALTGSHYGSGHVTIAWPQTMSNVTSGLSDPVAIAADSAGNVYVQTNNPYISKFAPNGTMTKIGSGFNNPIAVAVDSSGNVYVSDLYSQAIYKVSPPFAAPKYGTIVPIVAPGNAQADGLAIDGSGNLYYTNRCGKNCGVIMKRTPAGKTTTFATGLYYPESLSVDPTCTASCTIYETDYYSGIIYDYFYMSSLDLAGNRTPVTNTQIANPTAVAAGADGTAYVVDNVEHAVYKVPIGGTVQQIGSNWGYPTGIAVKAGCSLCPVWVTDHENDSLTEVH